MKGHHTYIAKSIKQNLTTQQKPSFKKSFLEFLSKERPSQILEIGTAGGGTIQYIRDTLDDLNLSSTKIKTFEVKEHKWFKFMRKDNLEIIVENIFDHSYRNLIKPELVESFIKQDGLTVVLCDGGSKINEFKNLAPLIKSGDYIMCHDYAPNKEYHEKYMKEKIWHWMEIDDTRIYDAIVSNKLERAYFQNFIVSAWGCFKKIK